jgi:hypothetical protein
MSRNFATLGPLELQPPFALAFGQVSDTINTYLKFSVSCVFVIQSLSAVYYESHWIFLVDNHESILPSSLSIVNSYTLEYLL